MSGVVAVALIIRVDVRKEVVALKSVPRPFCRLGIGEGITTGHIIEGKPIGDSRKNFILFFLKIRATIPLLSGC